MAAGRYVGFVYCNITSKLLEMKLWREHVKIGGSNHNIMKFICNLKIQVIGLPPCWIFVFAINILKSLNIKNRRKTTNLVTIDAIEWNVWVIKKIEDINYLISDVSMDWIVCSIVSYMYIGNFRIVHWCGT